MPGVPSILQPLVDRGAPLAMNMPGVTTGPEAVIGITKDARNPNAARLFAYWLLTPGGQAALNADPGSVSPWDAKKAPAGYTRRRRERLAEAARRDLHGVRRSLTRERYRSGSQSTEAAADPAPPPHSLQRVSAAVALFIAALAIYPLGTVLVRIFFTDGQLDLSGLRRDARRPRARDADQEHADRGRRQLGDRARHRRRRSPG